MEDIILIGGGGHCKSIIDSIKGAKEYNIVGILDIYEKIGQKVSGIEIVGTDGELEYYYKNGLRNGFLAIGSIGDTRLRNKLYKLALNLGYSFPNIIDKTSIVSREVELGHGNFIGKGSIINTGVRIGNNSIINTGSIIEHDCRIGDFCHIGPAASLSGGVSLGNNTHIGTNATVIQDRIIGENSIIGAGTTIVKNIGDNVKSYGNPLIEVKR